MVFTENHETNIEHHLHCLFFNFTAVGAFFLINLPDCATENANASAASAWGGH